MKATEMKVTKMTLTIDVNDDEYKIECSRGCTFSSLIQIIGKKNRAHL